MERVAFPKGVMSALQEVYQGATNANNLRFTQSDALVHSQSQNTGRSLKSRPQPHLYIRVLIIRARTKEKIMYEVLDLHTQKTFGPYATLKAARRTADRKDLQYGAIRYVVRPVVITNQE